jgi:hypothetical protein
VQAQSSQVTATGTVSAYSAVSGSGDLSFGTLSRTMDTVINAAGGAGAAQRTVDYNHNIRVSFSNVPTHLVAGGGTLQLPVSLTCASRVGAGSWSGPTACGQIDLDVGSSTTTATLGFGGTIQAAHAANAVAGTYSATLDIVVTAR